MRIEHFYLNEIIKGVENKITNILHQQDKNFADLINSVKKL